MSRRKEICREIIDQMHPDVVRRADRLLAKLLIKCPQAKADGADKVKFTADPDVLRVLATYASFGHRSFIDSMKSVLEERDTLLGESDDSFDEFDFADDESDANAGEHQTTSLSDDDPMMQALDDLSADDYH